MAELYRYFVENAEREPLTVELDDLDAARQVAVREQANLVRVTYVFDDSELVECYLPGRRQDGTPVPLHCWADGYGRWHCHVPVHSDRWAAAARDAIVDELRHREGPGFAPERVTVEPDPHSQYPAYREVTDADD